MIAELCSYEQVAKESEATLRRPKRLLPGLLTRLQPRIQLQNPLKSIKTRAKVNLVWIFGTEQETTITRAEPVPAHTDPFSTTQLSARLALPMQPDTDSYNTIQLYPRPALPMQPRPCP